jgi:ribosome recycling factor
MEDKLKGYLAEVRSHMDKSITHLEDELSRVRAGKIVPAMLDGITVDYYGTQSPITQVANVNTQDVRTMVIQPWEKGMLQPIEKAILAANIGMTPQNDGTIIRLVMPPLTEERRAALVKTVKGLGEQAKVGLRNIRRDAIEHIKKMQKDGLSEDSAKDAEHEVQTITDNHTKTVDKHLEAKEHDIMTV